MNQRTLRVVHYLNQFFGQLGGEDKADMPFLLKEGPIGPGAGLQGILGEKGDVVATIICGDNYFAERLETAPKEALELIAPYGPDLFFAGPAFEAGRYGMACGALCKMVQERLGIPAVTGMSGENPGVELYRRDVYICTTGKSAAKMLETLTRMVNLAIKLNSREKGLTPLSVGPMVNPLKDGYFARGIVKNHYANITAAQRGVTMLLAKIQGEPFKTELEVPKHPPVQPAPPMGKDLGSCEIALISDGGLAPTGNPDGLRGRNNVVWATYEIEWFFPEDHVPMDYEVLHTGYFPMHVLENPNRLVPVDVMRDLERERVIGRLHPYFYSTSGNATIQNRCRQMGEEISATLKGKGVDGAILTST